MNRSIDRRIKAAKITRRSGRHHEIDGDQRGAMVQMSELVERRTSANGGRFRRSSEVR
jgi:hypothetical protein